MNKAKRNALRHDYEIIANRYADALLEQFGYTWLNAWWANNEVGGIFVFGDENAISFEELIYTVDNDLSFEEYCNYIDYNLKMYDLHMAFVPLKNWHKGIGVISDDKVNKLMEMRKSLDVAIQESAEQALKSFD